jgi:tRNA(Ile)-lysidine synthase
MNADSRAAPPLAYIPPARHLLVGVSGGIDSVSLLHALLQQGHRKLTILHLDHRLRGPASTADARFVKALARRLNLPIISARADVDSLAHDQKLSLETAARQARYAFFAQAARQTRCRTLVLAHHADDQAETVLFNLLRGGASGLGGMRPRTLRQIDGVKLEILRPWLAVWRSEIEAYAKREKIRYREDASNASPAHTRNRLRTRILPMLAEEFGRDIRQSLWRAAEVLAAQQEWLDQSLTLTGEELPVPALRALPEALQRHTIHAWLRRMNIPQISFTLVESIRALLPPGASISKVNLPGAAHARRRAGRLFIQRTSFKLGQKIRVVSLPDLSDLAPDTKDRPTRSLFAKCVGKVLRIDGFNKYGLLELNVLDNGTQAPNYCHHTIWIEPEHVRPIGPSGK